MAPPYFRKASLARPPGLFLIAVRHYGKAIHRFLLTSARKFSVPLFTGIFAILPVGSKTMFHMPADMFPPFFDAHGMEAVMHIPKHINRFVESVITFFSIAAAFAHSKSALAGTSVVMMVGEAVQTLTKATEKQLTQDYKPRRMPESNFRTLNRSTATLFHSNITTTVASANTAMNINKPNPLNFLISLL